MRLRTYSVAMLVAVALAPAASGQPAPSPPRLREIVDVTVANVDVVVTDAKGNRVEGLTRDDFELLENGKPVKISNFAEISEKTISTESSPAPDALPAASAEAAPTPAPRRRVVVFVDLMTVRGIRRRNAIEEISGFLDQLEPGDERMVVSWDDAAVKVEIPPEADESTARAVLEKLVRRRSATMNRSIPMTASFRQHLVTGRKNRLLRSVHAVRALLTQMKPLNGRKVLILVTAGFPLRPGREIMMTPWYDEDTRAVRLYDGFVVEAQRLLDSLGDAANAAGVTLYTIHGLGATTRAAIGPKLVDPGLGETAGFGTLILPGIGVDPIYVDNSAQGLKLVAEKSGGVATARTNDIAGALRSIKEDLASYYSLGYHLSGALDAERNVEVRMRDPSLTARARTSIVVGSPREHAADAIVASLALPESPWGTGPGNELGISLVADRPVRAARGTRKIPLDVRIPLAPLSFEEEEDGLVAHLTLFIGAADAEKTLSSVERFEHVVRIARADLERPGAHYTYGFDVELRTRTASNEIAVAVVDDGTGLTGHSRVTIGSAAKR